MEAYKRMEKNIYRPMYYLTWFMVRCKYQHCWYYSPTSDFYHLLSNSLERIIKGGAFYTKSPANRSLADTGI